MVAPAEFAMRKWLGLDGERPEADARIEKRRKQVEELKKRTSRLLDGKPGLEARLQAEREYHRIAGDVFGGDEH